MINEQMLRSMDPFKDSRPTWATVILERVLSIDARLARIEKTLAEEIDTRKELP